MDVNMVIDAVKNLGFPAFCCLWMMYKGAAILTANTNAINTMVAAINNLTEVVDELKGVKNE